MREGSGQSRQEVEVFLGCLFGYQQHENDIDLATVRATVLKRLLQCHQTPGRYCALRYTAVRYGYALANRSATEFFPIE